jgi:hypothetical protein
MDTLPPKLGWLLLRGLFWLCIVLIGAFLSIGWWRITRLVGTVEELDRRISKVEAKVGLVAPSITNEGK